MLILAVDYAHARAHLSFSVFRSRLLPSPWPLIARSTARTRLVNPPCISRPTHTRARVYMEFYTVPLLHEARWQVEPLFPPLSSPWLEWTKREQLVRRDACISALYPSQYPTTTKRFDVERNDGGGELITGRNVRKKG